MASRLSTLAGLPERGAASAAVEARRATRAWTSIVELMWEYQEKIFNERSLELLLSDCDEGPSK